MDIETAVKVLRDLDPSDLRPILSDLATNTPGVVYWPKGFLDDISGKEDGEGNEMGRHGLAATMLANALSEVVDPGGKCEFEISGVSHGNLENGDWRIVATRLT